MSRVALLGKPVAESLSPRMQNAAFAAAGLDWEYVAIEVEPEALAETVRGLPEAGFVGANASTPMYGRDWTSTHPEALARSANSTATTAGFRTRVIVMTPLATFARFPRSISN